ncbi:GntR family transcriptional regulator [Parenemella sanctibonifatiensis]|uniref:HTH gntR-type domain-containing protein n=1 Tax=Parenemella sanctibonifatiensis TaxID=2016505 RepID=A0A255EL88_9ACTN|nr:GntR family transcriptional regulator [Parenemella sanctibonifatiensis]OYN92254.1 hypothetical protein CGZ91_01725 [Parenemella sanctibonifatiensis]
MSVAPASERIYRELRRRIIFAELKPAEEIDVTEAAAEFGTSRTPVRDALHRLDHDGLVRIRPRALCQVSPVTLKTVVDVLDVREATGPMATRLAVNHATADDVDALEAIAENGYAGAEDVRSILSASHLFHCRVAKLSGNRRLHDITEMALEDLERVFRLCGRQPLEPEQPLADHRALLQVFRAGDAEEAARLELDHIRRGREVVMKVAIDSGFFFREG